jgi:hypothetical protein
MSAGSKASISGTYILFLTNMQKKKNPEKDSLKLNFDITI